MRFKAVVFDWAGTMIDFGSFAPMGAFVEAFAAFQIKVTIDEARAPMGMTKRDHIKAMLDNPRIAGEWEKMRGDKPAAYDVDEVYKIFVPLNEQVAARYATLIPGALETIAYLRSKKMKIGSTTGYTRSIMARILPVAAANGYVPDNLVCSDDLKQGRPGPLGMYQCCVDLCVYPLSAMVKVDDTEPGISEGVSAGCVTVGVALSGNYIGKTPEELARMEIADVNSLRDAATARLKAAGANYVIDTVADLPALLEEIG